MRRLWRWLLGPAWVYQGNQRTDPATGRVEVWDDSQMTEWHSGDWVPRCCTHDCDQGRRCPRRR